MVTTRPERDCLLTDFGKVTLQDRYLLPGEDFQGMYARVATAFSDDEQHAERMYSYISQRYFMPATPVLSSGGTDRGLPISCFLNSVQDSMKDIAATWNENVWLGAGGGGIGTCWSNLRSIGQPIKGRGHSSGVIPFVRVMDSLTLAVSQGSLRRGSGAAYLDVSHPEIEEFIEIRKPTGDFNRKCLNIHHGVVLSDEFMMAVEQDQPWVLVDPATKQHLKSISARQLFQKILDTRMQTGEPYLLFYDNVNRCLVDHQLELGLTVTQSNLCSEIMLATGLDYNLMDRTAVCCLGSVNAETYDDWKHIPGFIRDCLRFLDNVLQDFINRTDGVPGYESARYAAIMERSVGLGVMGFHSYLQKNGIPFESALAKSFNFELFKFIRRNADIANLELAEEFGACPDSLEAHERNSSIKLKRFSHMLAIAPTASISIVCGGTSPCIEPWNTNAFTQKTLSGSFLVKNKYLERALDDLGMNTEEVWSSIIEKEGSIQHLNVPDHLKWIYKTAWEIDSRWIIDLAGDRTEYIDQGQSINLFLTGDIHKWDLLMLHITAWRRGIKSLYYLRSKSIQRAGFAGVEGDNQLERSQFFAVSERTESLKDYEECLACQ